MTDVSNKNKNAIRQDELDTVVEAGRISTNFFTGSNASGRKLSTLSGLSF